MPTSATVAPDVLIEWRKAAETPYVQEWIVKLKEAFAAVGITIDNSPRELRGVGLQFTENLKGLYAGGKRTQRRVGYVSLGTIYVAYNRPRDNDGYVITFADDLMYQQTKIIVESLGCTLEESAFGYEIVLPKEEA